MPARRQAVIDSTLEPAAHDQRRGSTEHGGEQQTARDQAPAFRHSAGQAGTHLIPDRAGGRGLPAGNDRVALG